MVGFETEPMAEGRPNDAHPFNFLQPWVTASSKGNLHKMPASQWHNYTQCLHFQCYHLTFEMVSRVLTLCVMDWMGSLGCVIAGCLCR